MARELLLIALVVACGRDKAAKPKAAAVGPPLASKAFYRVDAGPNAPCASRTTCEARLELTALGDYHVNKDYPFKFVGDPGGPPAGQPAGPPAGQPAVQIDGEGRFALDDAKHGIMTITFRPAAPGTAKLVGTFKLSVCSDETCEIESPKLELTVPVS